MSEHPVDEFPLLQTISILMGILNLVIYSIFQNVKILKGK